MDKYNSFFFFLCNGGIGHLLLSHVLCTLNKSHDDSSLTFSLFIPTFCPSIVFPIIISQLCSPLTTTNNTLINRSKRERKILLSAPFCFWYV